MASHVLSIWTVMLNEAKTLEAEIKARTMRLRQRPHVDISE